MQKQTHLPFFVYGTLLPEQPNFFLWGTAIKKMEPATFSSGQLYDMGYYPMMITAVPSELVQGMYIQGMCITVKASQYDIITQQLDELEGYDPNNPDESDYLRQQIEVVLADGRSLPAWAYLGQPQYVQGKPLIKGGSWINYVDNHSDDLQEWWKTIYTVMGRHRNE